MRTALEMADFCLGFGDLSNPEVRDWLVSREMAERQRRREEFIQMGVDPEQYEPLSAQGLTYDAALAAIRKEMDVRANGRYLIAELFGPVEWQLNPNISAEARVDGDVFYAFTAAGLDTREKRDYVSSKLSSRPKVAVAFTASRCIIGYRNKKGEELARTILYDAITGIVPQKGITGKGAHGDLLILNTIDKRRPISFDLGVGGAQTCLEGIWDMRYVLSLVHETVTELVTKYKQSKYAAQQGGAARAQAEPQYAQPAPPPQAAPRAGAGLTAEAVEALKQLKELLDMGVVTQEEFDAKKKQLLGL